MRLWRICKSGFSAAAFSGEGARLYEGRWNPAGVRMVYTSTSLALATVEFFVHLDPSDAPDDLVSVSAEFRESEVRMARIEMDELPSNWRTVPSLALQAIGNRWISAQDSVALEVPSAAVEGEWNVLLNPAHPDFVKIKLAAPRAFHFDQRMFMRKS